MQPCRTQYIRLVGLIDSARQDWSAGVSACLMRSTHTITHKANSIEKNQVGRVTLDNHVDKNNTVNTNAPVS